MQRPSIDVDALAAGVQRYLPGRPQTGYNNSYIALPPGVDPATVDFRTFYPYNPSEVKHRKRTTRPQLKVLEDTFKRETKPNAALRKQLAAQLEMTPRGVQVWFQNRRAKEKTLAKKAASSSANNGRDRKSISLGAQNGDAIDDADGDVDCDDGDTAAEDDNPNSEQVAQPAKQTPGTENALDERKRSHSSSNSPESTSPELTPPNAHADIAPHVNVSPDDDSAARQPEVKQNMEMPMSGFPPSSWQGPPRSMSRTPTLGMGLEQGAEFTGEAGFGGNGLQAIPMQDHYTRRPSLPTHLGIGPSRVRAGYLASPRASALSLGGGVNAARMVGYDPNARRMSLDRLASHPYAHVAAQANSLVYGPGATRFRPSLPATTHSTPTLTPQARTADLPPVDQQPSVDSNQNSNGDGDAASGIPELSLPPHLQHSTPVTDMRPELMHRQSLPAHLATPQQLPASTGFASQPQSASAMSMRFPRQGHVYTLSARNYQPPIPGPLPNPDFSFGSVGNGECEGAPTEGSGTPDQQLQSSLNNFQFPEMEKGDNGAAGGSNSLDMEMDGESRPTLPPGGLGGRPPVFYRDSQGLHGAANPYTPRFGSIASTASIADSESSVTSGACFSSEAGSGFDVQVNSAGHSSIGYNDTRRGSCTGSMMDMFSNLDVHNSSQSSLPNSHHDSQKKDQHSSHVPISRSSELALALMPDDDKTSSMYGGDNGSNVNVNMNDASDVGVYNRASMSSSDLSHGHSGHLHRHPLAALPRSAGSSRSSLGFRSRPLRLETDKIDFMHNFDAVSETGHYSPVSHPSPAPFEFPLSEQSGGSSTAHGSDSHSDSRMDHDGGMVSHVQHHQYGVDESRHASQQHHSGMYAPPHSAPYSLHGHSQENVAPYGYYN